MSGPNDVDRLLREWEDVASTAKPPIRDPRRSSTTAGAFPASMLLVAAIAVAVVAIVGRGISPPANPGGEPSSSEVPLSSDAIVEPVTTVPTPSASVEPLAPSAPPSLEIALSDRGVADDGRFRVELTSSGTVFHEGETIEAGAGVSFLGPEGSVLAAHGSPPVTFMVEELGGAERNAGGGVDQVCLRSTFVRDEAVPFPWQRGGSWSTDNPSPNDRFNMDYVAAWSGAQEGELRLPAGTWRLSATLDIAEGDCGPTVPRTASLVIRVEPATDATSAPPAPSSPVEEPAVQLGPVVVCDRVSAGDCEHAVALVRESMPGGRDTYAGASIVIVADTCTPGAVCDRQYPFDVTVLYALEDAVLVDSAASVVGIDGPEEVRLGEGFVAPWMLELVQDARALTPLPVADPQLPRAQDVCRSAALEGTLVEHPTLGLAVAGGDGAVAPVIWPWGLSRDDSAGPALVDATGAVLAVVGDPITATGGLDASGVFRICSFDA